jgi:hypothetical protein
MAALYRLTFGLLLEQEIDRGVARGDKIVVVTEFLNGCRFGTGCSPGRNCVRGFVRVTRGSGWDPRGPVTCTRMNVP